jgi:hypothetical protein
MISNDALDRIAAELADTFRQMANAEPASGKLQMMFRTEIAQSIGAAMEDVAKSHVGLAEKAMARDMPVEAVWHMGAAKYLSTLRRTSEEYQETLNKMLTEANNGRGKKQPDRSAVPEQAEDDVSVPPGFSDAADVEARPSRRPR